MTYKQYLTIAKSIFPGKSVVESILGFKFFSITGPAFFKNCDYILLQYNGVEKLVHVPYRLLYSKDRIYPIREKSNDEAYLIEHYRKYKNPTKKEFTNICIELLKQIKELQIKEKEDQIKEDFV